MSAAIAAARRWDAPLDWKADAACRTTDPDVFYPSFPDDEAAAKAICDRCDARGACLEYALNTNESEGIWGGLNERERLRERRRRLARGWKPPAVTMPATPDRREAYEQRSTEVWGARDR